MEHLWALTVTSGTSKLATFVLYQASLQLPI